MDITRIIFHRTDQSVHVKRGPLVQRKYYPTHESYTRLLRALDAKDKKGNVAVFRHLDDMLPGWTAMVGLDAGGTLTAGSR